MIVYIIIVILIGRRKYWIAPLPSRLPYISELNNNFKHLVEAAEVRLDGS